MKKNIILIMAGIIILTFAFTGCTRSGSSAAGNAGSRSQDDAPYTIEIGGSTSVTPLMEALADEYIKIKPNIKLNISGTGSGDGITNAGVTYQIGMTSRDLTPAELGKGLKSDLIAIDGIAVIVNKNNDISNLTIEQINGIYTGSITSWSQVGGRNAPIAVVSREEGSGTRGAFEEIVRFQGKLLSGANQLTSTGAILANVAQNQDAIGYISLGSINESIKALSIDGVIPVVENVALGAYKIARPFIVLSGSNIHPQSAAFIDWILSDAGQTVVSGKGYISIR